MSGEHERAVKRDLRRVPGADRSGALAHLALELARELDESELSSRDLAAVSSQYHAVLTALRRLQEPVRVSDPVDDLAQRRRERLADG